MDEVEQVVEQQMLRRADKFIDQMIPPEGISMFAAPGGGGFFGFGADDLTEDGSDAFAGLGESDDLTAEGTAAFAGFFAGMIDPDMPDDVFDGMGDLGRWGFRSFRNRLRAYRHGKRRMSRRSLRRVSRFHRKALNRAKGYIRKARGVRNAHQRSIMLNKAKAAAAQASRAKWKARELARKVVDPKINRAEARVAMRPVVKRMAKGVSKTGKRMIKRVAAIKKVPGGKEILRDAMKKGRLRKQIKAGLKKGLVKEMAPEAKKIRGKRIPRMSFAQRIAMARSMRAARARGRRSQAPSWIRRLKGTSRFDALARMAKAKRLAAKAKGLKGLFGLGEADILSESIAAEFDVSGVGEFLMPSIQPDGLPAIDGGEIGGFLSMGDMDTVSQEPESLDITQSWDTDDIYGTPLGF